MLSVVMLSVAASSKLFILQQKENCIYEKLQNFEKEEKGQTVFSVSMSAANQSYKTFF